MQIKNVFSKHNFVRKINGFKTQSFFLKHTGVWVLPDRDSSDQTIVVAGMLELDQERSESAYGDISILSEKATFICPRTGVRVYCCSRH